MKYKLIYHNFFLFTVFISFFYFSLSYITTGKYPCSKRLNNGYYAIASNNNITFIDSTFSKVVNALNFDPIYGESSEYIGSTSIYQFSSEYNGYVVVIILKNIYIFSSVGEFLAKETTSITKPKFPAFVIPFDYSLDNKYFFTLIYGTSDDNNEPSNYINFHKGKFNSFLKTITFEQSILYKPFNSNFFSTFSCILMKKNENDYIVCFYGTYNDLYISLFEPNNDYNCLSKETKEGNGGMYIKTSVLLDSKQKAMVCVFKEKKLKCYKYDIIENEITLITNDDFNNIDCGEQPYSFIMEYFYETENFVIGCRLNQVNSVFLAEFSNNFNFIRQNNLDNPISKDLYGNVERYNIILVPGQTKYSLLAYPSTNCAENCPFELIIKEFGENLENLKDYPTTGAGPFICTTFYNYERTGCIEDVPEGYYCNSTEQRTIDKCYNNCQTCNEGYDSSNNNHNCLTCQSGKYFDLGNCVDTCSKNYFNNGTMDKCKCSYNDACEDCSIESNNHHLCITCNSNYYPKKDDVNNIGNFINCYNSETIGIGYYLNINQYEPCHSNCLTCTEEGSDTDNKCLSCKSGFILIKNNKNIVNCYSKCPNYYYFDNSDNYICEDTCPTNYKIINSTNKCIDNCSNDDNNKYEYKGYCFEKCPNGTNISDTNPNICEDNLVCENGFINDNGILKCKCSRNECLLCSEESIENNSCISCNVEEGYYPKSDENIEENGFIKCYKNPQKYYLNNDKYYPCYQTCLYCSGEGEENENNCIECYSGYEFKSELDNNKNCYEICSNDNYYYLDSDNKYHCTTNNKCPDNYKKISSKKKCIDDCSQDNDYRYEYNNECVEGCPSDTHSHDDNRYKCIDNLNCEQSGKYYSYDGTECIDNIPSGFYCNNSEARTIEKCHQNCETCNSGPTDDNNNCLTCKEPKIYFDLGNCTDNCKNGIFTEYGIRKCKCSTDSSCQFCDEGSKLNNQCISCNNEEGYYPKCDDNENISPYLKCYKNPEGYLLVENPQNTQCYEYVNNETPSEINDSTENNFITEEIKEEYKEKCFLKEKELVFGRKKNEISFENVSELTIEFKNEYNISYDLVYKQENYHYKVYIYKNLTCLILKANEAPQADFGTCYEKVKNNYSIFDDDLIITIVIKKGNKEKSEIDSYKYYFSNPITGEAINISEICQEDKIYIQEDVKTKLKLLDEKQEEYIIFLTNQGIDVFNISDRFYNDLCFYFESPNGRDVCLKDRIAAFFPNLTLCDPDCISKGVDLEKMKAKCECTFNNLMKNSLMDNFYGQAIAEFMNVLNSFNINVVQCFKDIFDKNNFLKCVGGFFILALLSGKLLCMFIYIFEGLYAIRKYIFSLNESFNIYMKINAPPRKKKSRTTINFPSKSDNTLSHSSSNFILSGNNSKKNEKNRKSKLVLNEKNVMEQKGKTTIKLNQKLNVFDGKENENEIDLKTKMSEFLYPSFDENDFDDIMNKEKRTFCQYFSEKFQKNQIFINSFFVSEILKPRILKINLLIITIELYFVINALFYNEEYLSELFNSNKNDSFFSFIPRRLNQYIYTSAVSGIISYLMGYFFVEESKIRRIFLRNKNDIIKIKYELSVLVKNIKKSFIGLIIFSIFLSIISFIYICCFNIVYPYIRKEWIKSSLFILIIMQILNFLITFLESIFRYLAIKCNSKKMFKLSLWFA